MPTVDPEDLESLKQCVGREIGATGGSASRKSGSSNSSKRRKTASGFILVAWSSPMTVGVRLERPSLLICSSMDQ